MNFVPNEVAQASIKELLEDINKRLHKRGMERRRKILEAQQNDAHKNIK